MQTTIDPRTAPHTVARAARDKAVLEALRVHFPTGSLRARATALAAALAAHRASVYWPRERHHVQPPEGSSARHCALHEILRLDRGRALSLNAIRAIVAAADAARSAATDAAARQEGIG
jgi:hypothetical protein